MRRQINVYLTKLKAELPKMLVSFVLTYIACILILGNYQDPTVIDQKSVNESSEQRRCQSPEKILFLKCHKCSSNNAAKAVSKILLKTGTPTSEPFSNLAVDNDKDTLILDLDILHHWNYAKVRHLLGPRVVVVTMLSDPVDQFIDSLDHASLKLDMDGLIKLIQSKRFKEKNLNLKKEMQEFRQTIGWTNGNSMIHDLGFPSLFLDTEALDVDEYIAQLDRQIDLVLMSDRLGKSLALLRRQLCWSEEELLSTISSLGVNLYHQPTTFRYKLDPEERDQLRKWLGSADDQLYLHFSNIFNQKVASYPDIGDEIHRIRRTQYSLH